MLVGGKAVTTEPLVTATSCRNHFSQQSSAWWAICWRSCSWELSGLWYTLGLCQSTFSMHGEVHWII